MDKVYIRLLTVEDARNSFHWRNNPDVWKYTESRPNKRITYETELEWIKKVLKRDNEKRFAICESQSGRYIGNVQLTDINLYDAQLHIFIGEREYWGKGYGTEATQLILEYGFSELRLQSIYLNVKKENRKAIKLYRRAGFSDLFEHNASIRMARYKDAVKKKASVFVLTYNHEQFIVEALNGILRQKVNFDFDIVVGDDFSKDGTRKILLDYAYKYQGKFKLLFYPENFTAPVNQHWVFKNCLGEFAAMCEGDDYWTDPLKLQKQIDFLEANKEFVLCFHNIKVVDNSGNVVDDKRQPLESKRDFDKYELLDFYIPTPTLVFRKTFEELPKYFLKSVNGDILLLALLTKNGAAKYLPDIKESVIRIHSGGVWSSRTALSRWSSNLNTKYLLFKSLNKTLRKRVFSSYVRMYEMAGWDAIYYKSKRYWLIYNFRYLQFCLTAGTYGKALLIARRILTKVIIK